MEDSASRKRAREPNIAEQHEDDSSDEECSTVSSTTESNNDDLVYRRPPTTAHLSFRTSLKCAKVSRSFTVPNSISFRELHLVLQDLYEWADYHLHDFRKYGPDRRLIFSTYNPGDSFCVPSPKDQWKREAVPISSFFVAEKNWLEYEYDFGDSWEIRVELTKVTPSTEFFAFPKAIRGKRKPPEEDSRGELEEALYDGTLDELLPPDYKLKFDADDLIHFNPSGYSIEDDPFFL